MHVAMLSHEYPPFIFGGVGTLVRDLAYGLARRGTRVTVISGYPTRLLSLDHQGAEQVEDGITVIRFPYPRTIPPRHLLFQLANYKQLSKLIGNLDADVVHGQSASTFPTLLNLKHLLPVVVTFHASPRLQMISSLQSLTRGGSMRDFFTFDVGYPLWKYTLKKEFQISTANVVVSKTLMGELLQWIGDGRKNFSCIYNGVDLEMLDNVCKNSPNNEEDDPVILFGGRLFWNKGVFNVLKLAHLLQKRPNLNLRIAIYGSGPLDQTILHEIQRLGLTNIELKPFATRTEFISSMKRAMFVAVPSFYEACPMVLLECMCMGKIPLLFNVPFAREFTQDGKYGILANSAQDMVKKVESLRHSGYMDKLGSEIRSFSRKNYSINVTASRYELLYKELCS
jgi:glycosyltransferase involved in cell wall biosynthesis